MGAWMSGWVGGWMNGWMDRCSTCPQKNRRAPQEPQMRLVCVYLNENFGDDIPKSCVMRLVCCIFSTHKTSSFQIRTHDTPSFQTRWTILGCIINYNYNWLTLIAMIKEATLPESDLNRPDLPLTASSCLRSSLTLADKQQTGAKTPGTNKHSTQS